MRKIALTVCGLLALSGCKSTQSMTGSDLVSVGATQPGGADQAARDCQFESTKATVAIQSGIEQGVAERQVFERCISAKGYALRQG